MAFVHPSHDMEPMAGENISGEECFKCLVNTLSGSPELEDPCENPRPQPEVPVIGKSPILDIREIHHETAS